MKTDMPILFCDIGKISISSPYRKIAPGFAYREMNFPIDFTLTKCYDELVIEKGGDKAAARA